MKVCVRDGFCEVVKILRAKAVRFLIETVNFMCVFLDAFTVGRFLQNGGGVRSFAWCVCVCVCVSMMHVAALSRVVRRGCSSCNCFQY